MTIPGGALWREASDRTRTAALAVGVLHVAYGFALQWATRDPAWYGFDPLYVAAILGALYLVSGFGLFLAGALPVLLLARRRLLSPALVLVGWLVWGAYGYWTMRESLPLTSFTALQLFEFDPHPDYVFQAIPLLVVLAAAAVVELALRRAVRAATVRS